MGDGDQGLAALVDIQSPQLRGTVLRDHRVHLVPGRGDHRPRRDRRHYARDARIACGGRRRKADQRAAVLGERRTGDEVLVAADPRVLATIERVERCINGADSGVLGAAATVVAGGAKIDGARCIEEAIGSCGAATGVAAAALAIGALPETVRSRAVCKGNPGFFVIDFATAT